MAVEDVYFAWVDEGTAFDDVAHAVKDEDIFALTLSQAEGDFATLEIDIVNPREGLLATGRKQWCWLSYDFGTSVQPIFRGRLVAVMENLDGEMITLQFVSKDPDIETNKASLAATMRILPFWDPVWISGDLSNPDAVLAAYGARWHYDRVTLGINTSDELVPEDGTITLTADDILYASVGETYSQKPKVKGIFKGTLSWSQTGKGTIDMTQPIQSLFGADKTIYKYPASGVISTLTGDGLKSDWPVGGTSFGGGWTVNNDTTIDDANPTAYKLYTYNVDYRGLSPSWNPANASSSNSFLNAFVDYVVKFPVGALVQETKFDWNADRKRTEILEFTMVADIQPLESDVADTESTLTLMISASDTVTEPDPITGVMPIIDKRLRAYLPTARGKISVYYPLLLMRAELRRGARAIEHKLRTTWAAGLQGTLRKSILFPDGRLPGGAVSGKITNYKFVASPADGRYCDFVLGSAIGYGNTVSATAGTGVYAAPGYMQSGYQQFSGGQVAVPGFGNELVYQSLDDETVFPIDDDGVDLLNFDEITAVESLTLTGGLGTQITAVTNAFDPITALKDYPSRVCMQLKPVADQDPFETIFSIAVEPLPIPLGVDLTAAAS